MSNWEYRTIYQDMDFTDFDSLEDTMMLGPGYGPQFEWRDVPVGNPDRFMYWENRLKALAKEGWELVGKKHRINGKVHSDIYYLRRLVPAP